MRLIVVSIMVTLLSGCGSIISRTIPGQGHGNQYYPGVQWDVRDSAWRYVTILDLPFSLVFDTLLLPIDIHHGPINVHPTHQLLCVLPRYPAVAQAEIPPRPIHVMYSHLATPGGSLSHHSRRQRHFAQLHR